LNYKQRWHGETISRRRKGPPRRVGASSPARSRPEREGLAGCQQVVNSTKQLPVVVGLGHNLPAGR
jgi:hypothetical protein